MQQHLQTCLLQAISMSSAVCLKYCNECVIRKILFGRWVIDVLYRVRGEVAFCWAVQYTIECQSRHFLHSLMSLHNPKLEGNCPQSHNLSFGIYMETSSFGEEET